MKFSFVILLTFLTFATFAKTVEYRLGSKSGIDFVVPYGPLGLLTHSGKAELERASLFIDSENLAGTTGEFSVSLSSLTMDNSELDCHMREALGLNYNQSDYPEKHVCTEAFGLPLFGKNAIVYPEILFKILSIKNITQSDMDATFEIEGAWVIHGVILKQILPIKLSPEKNKLRISTVTKFKYKDFNIHVKPAKVFFFPIEVKDPVTVEINLLLDAYPSF